LARDLLKAGINETAVESALGRLYLIKQSPDMLASRSGAGTDQWNNSLQKPVPKHIAEQVEQVMIRAKAK